MAEHAGKVLANGLPGDVSTVSAARGCSPTARVRRPQRERKRRTWRTMTRRITDIVMGGTARNVRNSQPTTGRSTRPAGGTKGWKVPALPVGLMRRFR